MSDFFLQWTELLLDGLEINWADIFYLSDKQVVVF
jgi:hypothetical protein